MFAPRLRKAAQNRLTEEGVAIHLNCAVTSVNADGISLSNNTTVSASTIIWSAGVKAIVPKFIGTQPTLVKGRMSVNEYFQIKSSETDILKNVFVLGDAASYPTPVPMLAQAAEAQASAVGNNILASINNTQLSPFVYKSKGSMVSVGQWFAIGEIFSIKTSGRLTWWLWRTVYLSKFASFKKRIRIMFEWTLEIFFPRDITKILE